MTDQVVFENSPQRYTAVELGIANGAAVSDQLDISHGGMPAMLTVPAAMTDLDHFEIEGRWTSTGSWSNSIQDEDEAVVKIMADTSDPILLPIAQMAMLPPYIRFAAKQDDDTDAD